MSEAGREAGAERGVSSEAAEIGAHTRELSGFGPGTPLGEARRGHIPGKMDNAGDVNVPHLETSLGAAFPPLLSDPRNLKSAKPPASRTAL